MVEKLEPIFMHYGENLKGVFISRRSDASSVLFWNKERGVVKYSLDGRKTLQTWPIPASVIVTSLVNENNGSYSCIFNDKTFCQWTDDHLNPMKGKIYDFSSELIHRHHPVALGKQEYIFVTKRGDAFSSQLEEIDKVLSQLKDTSNRCLFSDVLDVQNEKILLSVIFKEAHGDFVRVFPIQKGNSDFQNEALTPKEDTPLNFLSSERRILSCCLLANSLKLLVLDDQGSIHYGDLEPNLRDSGVKQISMVQFHSLCKEGKFKGNNKINARLVPIGANHFAAIYGCSETPNMIRITICSNQFWTVAKEYEVELQANNNNEEKAVEILSAECCGEFIIIGTSHSILACPISLSKPSLASLIGKAQKRAATSTSYSEQLFVLPVEENNKSTSVLQESERQKEGLSYLQKLACNTECLKKEEFESTLQSYIDLMERPLKPNSGAALLETSDSGEVPRKRRRFISKQPSHLVPQSLLEKITHRLLTEESIWSEQSMENLIEKRLLSTSHQINLVHKLISKKSLRLLAMFFASSRGLREDAVIESLKFALQYELDMQKSHVSGTKVKESGTDLCPPLDFKEPVDQKDEVVLKLEDPEVSRKPFYIQYHTSWSKSTDEKYQTAYISSAFRISKDVQKLLSNILSIAINESVIEEKLQDLTMEETEVLLDFLGVQAVRLYSFSKQSRKRKMSWLTHGQVIDWVSCIVNAKFASLVLSPKITRILSRLQFNIRQELRTEHCLQGLQPYFAQLEEKKELPNFKDEQPYQFLDVVL